MIEQAFKVFTDARIDEFTAGDSLDALVAKYVMGYGGNEILQLFKPSKNAECASRVVENVKALGATRAILDESCVPNNRYGRSQVSFLRDAEKTAPVRAYDPVAVVHPATGETLPEAICKAALKFVMGIMRQKAEPAPAAVPPAPEAKPERKPISPLAELALVQACRAARAFVDTRCATGNFSDGPDSVAAWKAFFALERAIGLAEERFETDCAAGYKLPLKLPL